MKASELRDYLQQVISDVGDCEVLLWDPEQMMHVQIKDVHFYTINDLQDGLEDDEDFMKDFNYIVENIVIS